MLAIILVRYLIPNPSPSPMEKGDVAAKRETNTMPGYAGSSWYFLRYMDPNNDQTFCDKTVSSYWNQVDLYVGGTEHAVGHLLYSRMWTKCLFDLALITFDEPFKKLLNQGMIQGSSRFVYRITSSSETGAITKPLFVSVNKLKEEDAIRNWILSRRQKNGLVLDEQERYSSDQIEISG